MIILMVTFFIKYEYKIKLKEENRNACIKLDKVSGKNERIFNQIFH